MTYKLTIIASVLFAVGVAAVIWTFVAVVMNLRRTVVARISKKRFPVVKVVVLVLGLILVALSQLTFWVNAGLGTFVPIDPDKPFCVLTFEHPQESDPIMYLVTRKANPEKLLPIKIIMRSDVAVLEVEVLRFPAFLNSLDFKDVCRLSSVKFLSDTGVPLDSLPEKRIRQNSESLWNFFDLISGFLSSVKTSKIVSDPIYFQLGSELTVYTSASRIVLSE